LETEKSTVLVLQTEQATVIASLAEIYTVLVLKTVFPGFPKPASPIKAYHFW